MFCCSDKESKLELEQMMKVSMFVITESGDFYIYIDYEFKLLAGIWIPNMYLYSKYILNRYIFGIQIQAAILILRVVILTPLHRRFH